ncbi:hypothetical protein T4E_4001 [Trichinella pseudospiralis]|uniref:Uncharacterized protein n=1 Tax=Trichinella pseudospiralis TaxID=6337 RepID=A0A0V0YJR0_TRIPS|nr:hypothetical protein T4E_4001 [Trichinella pseudospiralis]
MLDVTSKLVAHFTQSARQAAGYLTSQPSEVRRGTGHCLQMQSTLRQSLSGEFSSSYTTDHCHIQNFDGKVTMCLLQAEMSKQEVQHQRGRTGRIFHLTDIR